MYLSIYFNIYLNYFSMNCCISLFFLTSQMYVIIGRFQNISFLGVNILTQNVTVFVRENMLKERENIWVLPHQLCLNQENIPHMEN